MKAHDKKRYTRDEVEDMRILMWMLQIAFGVLIGWDVFVLFTNGHLLSAILYIAGYVIWTTILIYVSIMEWQEKSKKKQ